MEKVKSPIETLNNGGNNGKKTEDNISLEDLGELIEKETELVGILEPTIKEKEPEKNKPEESTAEEKPEILGFGERKLEELKIEIAEAIENADQNKVGELLKKAKGWEIFVSNIENQNLFKQKKDALLEKQSEAIQKGDFSETGNIKTEIETLEKQNRDKRDVARLGTAKYLYPEKAERAEKYLSGKKRIKK